MVLKLKFVLVLIIKIKYIFGLNFGIVHLKGWKVKIVLINWLKIWTELKCVQNYWKYLYILAMFSKSDSNSMAQP